MLRVCLSGLGRTGKEIARVLLAQKDIKLVSVICSSESKNINRDISEILECKKTGIIIESSDNLELVVSRTKPDVVIDFSNPNAAFKNAIKFSKMKTNIVIGTTGFTKTTLKKLFVLTRKYNNGIVYAPNITLGVNVLMLLSNLAANILNDYNFQITEVHHKNKKDFPLGTAVKISNEIAKGLASAGNMLDGNEIPINSVRAGGVIGKHEVLIVGEEDKIEITHESFSRKAFAIGAIKAARFIQNKSGYFEMTDVLNLGKVFEDY